MNIDGALKKVVSIAQLSDVVMKLVHNLIFAHYVTTDAVESPPVNLYDYNFFLAYVSFLVLPCHLFQ